MMFRFLTAYRSHIGSWKAGDVAEFDAETAAWILRDVPGCMEVETPPAPKTEAREVDAPPQDRMTRKPVAATRKR